jgi:demethylmenaquinone methyltransferase/2-methoxy-6-polyprenyl-1,4-benzoquinol methylase
MNDPDPLSRSFGDALVDAPERERRIRRVFEAVAPRYDLMNDLMSLGIHRLWKHTLARMAAPLPGQRIVDLAGGTGDVAARLAGPDREVTVIDPSEAMMAVGRRRGLAHVHWLSGSAERLPLAEASVDTITIAFGIRNVTHLHAALAEAHRVLVPGGRFLCLEFSTPRRWLKPFYDAFSFAVIPRLGALIAGTPQAYVYLVESIRRFPSQPEFAAHLRCAGFEGVHWRDLSFGIACIHVGQRAAASSIPTGATPVENGPGE